MASVAVDFLVKNNYLIRQADSSDRRVWRLILTSESEDIVQEGRKLQLEFGQRLTAGISQAELSHYMDTAEKFKNNILNLSRNN